MFKKDLLKYYTNKLFEIQYGYYELHTGVWNGISMLYCNKAYPFKIHKKYDDLPIHFPNISHYILYINGQECNNFDGRIINNKRYNRPSSYDILIYFKEQEYPIHYTYKFGDYILINYKKKDKNYKQSISLLNDKIMEINSKIYLLDNISNSYVNTFLQPISDTNIVESITDLN
tara:strand:- start:6824 stop:7345 length:522 start_codon:yes stop_codon:yes gene_type:complete